MTALQQHAARVQGAAPPLETQLEIVPVAGRIGAEISGVDLGCLDDGDVAAIRQELLAHRVVFFRDQTIGAAEQIAFEHENPDFPPLGLKALLRDAMRSVGDNHSEVAQAMDSLDVDIDVRRVFK